MSAYDLESATHAIESLRTDRVLPEKSIFCLVLVSNQLEMELAGLP
jgi:hypothetical protein